MFFLRSTHCEHVTGSYGVIRQNLPPQSIPSTSMAHGNNVRSGRIPDCDISILRWRKFERTGQSLAQRQSHRLLASTPRGRLLRTIPNTRQKDRGHPDTDAHSANEQRIQLPHPIRDHDDPQSVFLVCVPIPAVRRSEIARRVVHHKHRSLFVREHPPGTIGAQIRARVIQQLGLFPHARDDGFIGIDFGGGDKRSPRVAGRGFARCVDVCLPWRDEEMARSQ